MKTIDEREMQKTTKEKQIDKRQKKQRHKWAKGTEVIVKEWALNDFVVHLC